MREHEQTPVALGRKVQRDTEYVQQMCLLLGNDVDRTSKELYLSIVGSTRRITSHDMEILTKAMRRKNSSL